MSQPRGGAPALAPEQVLGLIGRGLAFDQFWPSLSEAFDEFGWPRLRAAYSSAATSGSNFASPNGGPEFVRLFADDGDAFEPLAPHRSWAKREITGAPAMPVELAFELGQRVADGRLLLVFDPPVIDEALVAQLCRQLYHDAIQRQVAHMRHVMSQLSMSKFDLNSFAHKVINKIMLSELGIGAAFTLIERERRPFLELGAAGGISTDKKKVEIQVFKDDRRPLLWEVFSSRHPYFTRHYPEFLEDFFSTHAFRTRTLEPLAHAIVPLTAEEAVGDEDRTHCVGVIWAALTKARGGGRASRALFTWEDAYFLRVLANEVGFRALVYRHSDRIGVDHDRLYHGINVNVLAAKQTLEMMNKEIFETGNYRLAASERFTLSQSEREIEHMRKGLKTSIALLDDLHFQVRTSHRDDLDSEHEVHVVQNLFSNVLQKAVTLSEAIALAHSRRQPRINNLKKAGAEQIPPVMGNDAALLTVFRNLFENAIKYTPDDETPHIELWFEDGPHYYTVHVRDHGIGVPEDEIDHLFKEGVRGVEARRVSFRGAGIGLAHCRRIMAGLKGDISFEPVEQGAQFAVKMQKAP